MQPIISLNNNDSICQGQFVQLTSSNGNSYQWHPTNQTNQAINVNTTGTYSVTVNDVFGCAVTSQSINIYKFPLPAIPSIMYNADTLTSSSLIGNQWYLNGTIIPNATNQTYIIQLAGTYKVTVTDTNGLCTSTSSDFLGIEDVAKNGVSFLVYPTPTNGPTTLIFQTLYLDDLLVEISDIEGKIVISKKYESFIGRTELKIDMGIYGSGLYLVSIKNSKGKVTNKIVVY
jgi:hypothetical protein